MFSFVSAPDTRPSRVSTDPSRRGVLEAGFQLIDAVAGVSEGLCITELARVTDLPKTTAHRLARQLVEVGALERIGDRYVVGDSVLRWGKVRPSAGRLYAAAYLPVRRLGQLSGALTGVIEDSPDGPNVVVHYSRDGVPFTVDPSSTQWHHTAVARLFALGIGKSGMVAYDRGDVMPGLSCVAVSLRLKDHIPAAVAALYFRPDLPPAAASMAIATARTIQRNWALPHSASA